MMIKTMTTIGFIAMLWLSATPDFTTTYCVIDNESDESKLVSTSQLWIPSLPQNVQDGILWQAEHEQGDTCEWTMCDYQYPGGGIFNTGLSEVTSAASDVVAHSGDYSMLTQITNACEAQNGSRAVRLMRWTDTAWDNGGELLPTEVYYSTWFYMPHRYNPNKYPPYDPGDGGWWNVFQFKSIASNGSNDPIFTLNVEHHDDTDEMSFYLYTKENTPSAYEQGNTYKPIPVGEWFHIEAYYKASDSYTPNGEVKFWQDGELILEANNVVTFLTEKVVFGIGNYTDHITGPEGCGTATIYFDDVIIGTEAVHPYVNIPTGPECPLIDNGDFSTDLQQWSDWNCEMAIQNGEAYVDITGTSAGIKKGNGSLTFEVGKTYRINFDARAEANRILNVKATLDYPPYDLYYNDLVQLTTTMQSYELTFTMTEYSTASSLEFNFGSNLTNVYFDNVQVTELDCNINAPLELNICAWLEGTYDASAGKMNNTLETINLLPSEQSYNQPPWNYTGTETLQGTDIVDWVLVSFRTDISAESEVAKAAGLLQSDGCIYFSNDNILPSGFDTPVYIVVQHRNHIPAMTPQAVTVVNNVLSYDFRSADSYTTPGSYGQKQLPSGEWALLAGDIDSSDPAGYDINGGDKSIWNSANGLFNIYLPADLNQDGDVNGADKALWVGNNGGYSSVPK